MRKIGYLIIAITGNALGTAIMEESNVGMTAWGSSALNTSNFLGVNLGIGFVVLSVFFYIIANIIRRRFDFKELVFSFLFLFSYAYLVDVFLWIIPSIGHFDYFYRLLIDVFGLMILLFSISVHLKINIAVHPLDVYLHELQKVIGISYGTYLAYSSAFILGVGFGLLHGGIEGIGLGTVITLTCSGFLMKLYNEKILDKWMFKD